MRRVRVAGSTILVTGASSGIGAATARAVARAGGRPVLLARRAPRLEELAAELGDGARAYALDCADSEAVGRAAAQIAAEVGTPDVVVNNAGAGRWLYLDETEPAELEAMMGAPYFAAAFVTRAFLPAMIERGSGLIVNVNTPIAYVPYPGATGYGAARWALRGLADCSAPTSPGPASRSCRSSPEQCRATTPSATRAWRSGSRASPG